MKIKHNKIKQSGFTLVELVTVIIILGIMSVVVSAKFFNNTTFDDTRYHQEVLSAMRYAQKIAIASQNTVTVCLTSNSYALYYSDNVCSGSYVKHPADQSNFTDTIAATITPVANYTFNAAGQASTSAGWSFTVGGNPITVEQITGFVHD